MRHEDRFPEIEDLEDMLELAILQYQEEFRREYNPRHRHRKHHKHYAHRTTLILTTSINNSIFKLMDANLATNQKQAFTFGLLDDTNPDTLVTGTYANGSITSDNESVAVGSVDDSGNVVFTAKGVGSANLTPKADVTYTNSLGKLVTETKTGKPIAVTVIAVVTADAVELVLTPGAITTQAAAAPVDNAANAAGPEQS